LSLGWEIWDGVEDRASDGHSTGGSENEVNSEALTPEGSTEMCHVKCGGGAGGRCVEEGKKAVETERESGKGVLIARSKAATCQGLQVFPKEVSVLRASMARH